MVVCVCMVWRASFNRNYACLLGTRIVYYNFSAYCTLYDHTSDCVLCVTWSHTVAESCRWRRPGWRSLGWREMGVRSVLLKCVMPAHIFLMNSFHTQLPHSHLYHPLPFSNITHFARESVCSTNWAFSNFPSPARRLDTHKHAQPHTAEHQQRWCTRPLHAPPPEYSVIKTLRWSPASRAMCSAPTYHTAEQTCSVSDWEQFRHAMAKNTPPNNQRYSCATAAPRSRPSTATAIKSPHRHHLPLPPQPELNGDNADTRAMFDVGRCVASWPRDNGVAVIRGRVHTIYANILSLALVFACCRKVITMPGARYTGIPGIRVCAVTSKLRQRLW